MGFFDEVRVPPPSRPESFALPVWMRQPDWVAPRKRYVDIVIARTDALVLSIAVLKLHPSAIGFDLRFSGKTRTHNPLSGVPSPLARSGPALADGGFAFGVLFADGRTAIANRNSASWPRGPADGPVLWPYGGAGGSGSEWRMELWLWPLPPPGPLEFVCEWPLEGLPESGAAIEF